MPPFQQYLRFVVSGPSGVGKGTLCKMVCAMDAGIGVSISNTTRAPRPGEVSGVHYHFDTMEQFEARILNNEFVEEAIYNGNRYGTTKASSDVVLTSGRDVIHEIECVGAKIIRDEFRNVVSIFILPPSFAVLEARIRNRSNLPETEIEGRLIKAREELMRVEEFDFFVVNEDGEQERAAKKILSIIRASRAMNLARVISEYPKLPELVSFRRSN